VGVAVLTGINKAFPGEQAVGLGQALPPKDPEKGDQLITDHAESAEINGTQVHFKGGVQLRFRGYTIEAEEVIGDTETEIFELKGKAVLEGKDSKVVGAGIRADFKNGTYAFTDGAAQLSPETLTGQLQEHLYIRGSEGAGREGLLEIEDSRITTCDLEDPHFAFLARSSEVIFGDRVLLKGFKLRAWNKTIFSAPTFSVPLDDDPGRNLPEIGQSRDEGFYIKTKFTTQLAEKELIDYKVDVMSRLGVGLGAEWEYDRGETRGLASAYGVIGPQTGGMLRLNHMQPLGPGRLSVNSQVQNSYYRSAPGSILVNTRGTYTMPTGKGTTTLGFGRNSSSTEFFNSTSENYSLNDNRRFNTGANTRLNVSYNSTRSSGFSGNEVKSSRFDVRFSGTQPFRSFDAELMYQRAIPVGDSQNFFSSSDRTPMLTLRTTTQKLFGSGSKLPNMRTELALGELVNPATKETVSRIYFKTDMSRTEKLQEAVNFNWNAGFRQGMYSDDTAQYTLNYGGRFTWQLQGEQVIDFDRVRRPKGLTANLSYRRMQSFGFTPLFIDRTGRSDSLLFDFRNQVQDHLELSFGTGYDMVQAERGLTPWQLLNFRANWRWNKDTSVQTWLTYDSFSESWSTLRFESKFRMAGARWALNTRFDARRSLWAGGTLGLRDLEFGKLNASLLLDWSGYTNSLNAMHLQLAYDLHCMDAVLEIMDNRAGFRSGQQIGLFIRVKALPGGGPYGQGRRGEMIGSGFGGFGG
jgi:LPS-assembly protein